MWCSCAKLQDLILLLWNTASSQVVLRPPSLSHSLTRVLAPSVFWEFCCSSISLPLSPFLLCESRSKEVFISGGAMDPSPRSNGARTGKQKREAAKLRTKNERDQTEGEKGKRMRGR